MDTTFTGVTTCSYFLQRLKSLCLHLAIQKESNASPLHLLCSTIFWDINPMSIIGATAICQLSVDQLEVRFNK